MKRLYPHIRSILFYAISLVLSLITIVVSSTVFIIVVYLTGSVSQSFIALFIFIAAINSAILCISIRGIIKRYLLSAPGLGHTRVVVINSGTGELESGKINSSVPYNEKLFTEYEAAIVDLLKENRNGMLQSTITSSLSTSKATVSRALSSLENKGVIIRMRKGVTNEVILTETGSR